METYNHVLDNELPEKKQAYWEIALGLQEVDNLKPSEYMRGLVKDHIEGKKSYEEVTSEIRDYYHLDIASLESPREVHVVSGSEEADIVADAIYEILHDSAFRFDIPTFKNYHFRLFRRLNSTVYHPGEFRIVNLTKKEPILNGKSVQYQDFGMVEESLTYDFEEEARQNYFEMSQAEKVRRLATFTSRIWQVHPFYEGNTRTTAIFIEKYLMNMGYEVDNDLLGKHAKEFRDALVLANYTSVPDGIQASLERLEKFIERMMER